MFYYGLDFHELPPNSVMHISTVITVCKALSRVHLHFVLWHKVFNVKLKSVSSNMLTMVGCDKQDLPCAVAEGHLDRHHQGLAEGVVVHHEAMRSKLDNARRVQIWTPDEANLMGQEGPRLGLGFRCEFAAKAHQEDGGDEHPAH